jgi:hypothetical protein
LLRGIRKEQTQLDGVTVKNVNLRWSTIRNVRFKNASLVKCNLSQTAFDEFYFRRALFQKCDVVNAKFSDSDFSDARIEGSWLDFSTFTSCEIVLRNILAFGTLQYWLNRVPGISWFDHTYFSGITFLTIGYGDLAPVGMLPRALAVLEGAAGIATFGMLIASAAKKIMYR